jgi:hypothetical protein
VLVLSKFQPQGFVTCPVVAPAQPALPAPGHPAGSATTGRLVAPPQPAGGRARRPRQVGEAGFALCMRPTRARVPRPAAHVALAAAAAAAGSRTDGGPVPAAVIRSTVRGAPMVAAPTRRRAALPARRRRAASGRLCCRCRHHGAAPGRGGARGGSLLARWFGRTGPARRARAAGRAKVTAAFAQVLLRYPAHVVRAVSPSPPGGTRPL